MIELQNFSKNYYEKSHKTPVFSVNDINIKIQNGKITALLGPNGSGKTTIIKAICGFHNPSAGKILIENSEVLNSKIHPMEQIGYVPEISQLPPDIKVIDFLKYSASIHSFSLKNPENSISKVIEKCNLQDVLNKKIKTLSKGYQQRVSFAQALIHNPKNLILDEPISGLDPAQIVQMRKLIKELAENKAILISTHILQEVTSLCNQVYIINKGLLVAEGTEEQIIKQQKTANFEEAFIKLTT